MRVLKGRARVLARGLVLLLPIALALAIVSWWPRPLAVRLLPVVASPPAPVDQEHQLSEAIERARASTLALEYGAGDSAGRRRVATGVVVSDQGDVLSIRVDPPEGHERQSILARDSAGHQHPARWMAADPETGLTLLRVDADDVQPIRPAARAAILGAAVFLIGNPYGLGHSVSRGNVAGLNRRADDGSRPLGGLIQIQVALHPGDNGALLADGEGGWLGLVRGSLAAPDAKDDNNLGFAIPALDAMWVAGQLLTHGKVDRAFLGIRIAPDTPTEPGAIVALVIEGSPAEKAKLQPGDRIAWLDEQPILTSDDLTDQLDRTPAGAEVRVDYFRDSVLQHLVIRTAARELRPSVPAPASTPVAAPAPAPGVPRELLERLDRLERELEELRHREPRVAHP
jgi:serine protease Do